MVEQVYREFDRFLEKEMYSLDLFSDISPVNEEKEKKRFFHRREQKGDFRIDFEYEEVDQDTGEMRKELEEFSERLVNVGESPVKDLYMETVEKLDMKLEMVESIGEESMKQVSREYYGDLEKETLELAEEILSRPRKEETVSNIRLDYEIVKQEFERTIEEIGIDWKVLITGNGSVRTDQGKRRLIIRDNTDGYSPERVERLKRHEIGVHALRAENGSEQDYGILRTGAGGYEETEEGIAATVEEMTGYLDPEVLRKYAARVKAVDMMMRGEDFEDTYEMLRDNGIDGREKAWRIATRAFRGGGFCKDHIYLQGYRKVKEYLEEDGKLEDLFIGKVSLEQAEALKDEGSIKAPEYSPAEIDPEIEDYW